MKTCGWHLFATSYSETDAAKAAREKTVVVSSSTKVLDLISKMRQHEASSCVRLDGATRHDLRAGLVDRFQQDPGISLFLLSTKAGGVPPCPISFIDPSNASRFNCAHGLTALSGVGLNLVAASRLILVDLSWNPSDDAQAW